MFNTLVGAIVDVVQSLVFRFSGGITLSAEDFADASELRGKLAEVSKGRMVAYRSSPNRPDLDQVWRDWIGL